MKNDTSDTAGMSARHEEMGSTRHEESGSARHAESSPKEPAPGYPTLENYDDWLFEVEGTVLKKYYGEGPVVQIPYGVTEIGKSAFSNCDSLKGITIPASVMSIGDWVFWGCDSLQEITIPASVTSIGVSAFSSCSSLEKITVDPANRAYRGIGNCLIEFKSRTLVAGCKTSVIPSGVKAIGANAFRDCALKEISIPKSVTSIEDFAFLDCSSLQEITIPASVTEIGFWAFCGCSALTIYCEAKEKPEGWDVNWNYSNRPVVWGKK